MKGALQVLLAVSIGLVCACGRGPETTGRVVVPQLQVADDPAWTGAQGEADFPVAQVGKASIPASRLRRALEAEPARDPRAVLDALIDRELAAQAAVGGLDLDLEVEANRLVWERALVKHLMDDLFQSGYGTEDVPRAHLEALFAQPAIWARFNHPRLFDVQDYQWICCDGRPAACNQPEVQACFAEGQAAMAAVYQALSLARPDPEDLPFLIERYQASAPRLAYQEYSFAYDEERGIQRGRVLFDDAVVARVVQTGAGNLAQPVRSQYGWHVLYVRSSVAPERRDLEDPDVRREIAETFRARLQQMRFLEFLATLVGTDRLMVLKAYFQDRPAPPGRPAYDVEIYLDSLKEAVDSATSDQDDEPI